MPQEIARCRLWTSYGRLYDAATPELRHALRRSLPRHLENVPVTFDGVDCCIYVDEFGHGELITVELIPEDEDNGDRWPLDVLRLPQETQQEILKQLRASPAK